MKDPHSSLLKCELMRAPKPPTSPSHNISLTLREIEVGCGHTKSPDDHIDDDDLSQLKELPEVQKGHDEEDD